MLEENTLLPLTYQSGVQIKKEIESCISTTLAKSNSSPIPWSRMWKHLGVQEYERGVMMVEQEPKNFGRIFITKPEDDCELIFVSRQD